MTVIGLTGGIASGKSTVSRILKELGAEIIDADMVAKEVIRPQLPAWRELVATFGRAILNDDKTINRRKLGQMVFGNPEALAKLNTITHPRIIQVIKDRIEQIKRRDETGVIVIDAPLLIEAGMVSLTDEVWLVMVDPDIQLSRLMARDHFTFQEALNRLNAQMSPEEKMKYARRIIDNRGPVEETTKEVVRLWQELKSCR
ncbi:MAG: dephospho-CoA kinase [Firmicutes bacterium]|nr:dephospho-CoA kinase [Bacillota bacterium]MCL5039163.1 dephospho-CoA kinase [Bacillota bacterium]